MRFDEPFPGLFLLGIAAFLCQVAFNYFKESPLDGIISNNFDVLCHDTNNVNFVQKRQLRQARLELFGDDHRVYHGENNLFYDFNFGIMSITAEPAEKRAAPKKALNYYRIWKSGNDNIRAQMGNFVAYCNSQHSCQNTASFQNSSSDTVEFCVKKCTQETTMADALGTNNKVKSPRRNEMYENTTYGFTFVRDPLSRFISGYTEIEYRLHKARDRPHYLPLFAKVGSQNRFKEFIRMILKLDGSKALMIDKNGHLPHIVPQIGTLLFASQREKSLINMFKLEDFDNEWRRLANASGFLGLKNTMTHEQLAPHPTSLDPLKTTRAAMSFLAAALNETHSSPLNPTNAAQQARLYLRAICRIYLVDYLCTNQFYELPVACADIPHEVQSLLDHKMNGEKIDRGQVLHFIIPYVPRPLLRAFAEVYCLFGLPQCVTDIMHGKNSGVDVD